MNIRDIEHMWKVASNNPNHDTNWHDPVVIAFAHLVAAAARADEREACAKLVETTEEHRREARHYIGGEEGVELLDNRAAAIRARGTT